MPADPVGNQSSTQETQRPSVSSAKSPTAPAGPAFPPLSTRPDYTPDAVIYRARQPMEMHAVKIVKQMMLKGGHIPTLQRVDRAHRRISLEFLPFLELVTKWALEEPEQPKKAPAKKKPPVAK